MAIDENPVKQAFDQVNELLAGQPMEIVVAALQDLLLVASICYATPDIQAAKNFCADIHRDLQKTIDRNFDHYSDPKNAASAAKRRSH